MRVGRVSDYQSFLASRRRLNSSSGRPCEPGDVNAALFEFQRAIVGWAVRKGRAAVWTTTGTGKTRMQVAWLDRILNGEERGLILAPLAVAQQTINEAAGIGVKVEYVHDAAETKQSEGRIVITNYDRLHLLDPAAFTAVVLDESSILKDYTAKTRTALIDAFADTPYRLACSATPSPNDVTELANHAEFLGYATRENFLAAYFVHDDSGWRLKGHAVESFWAWVASWAVAMRLPSDLGYSDDGYVLPPLNIHPQIVDVNYIPDGQLFATELGGVGGRAKIRQETLQPRCEKAAGIVNAEEGEPWLLWCGLNDEADLLTQLIPGAVNVHGSMDAEGKTRALLGFAAGDIRVLVTKPKIAAQGMNYQHCARMVFVGLSDSYEQYFQAIRRCYRFGQRRPVDVHIVLSRLEAQIAGNVRRKENEMHTMQESLIRHVRDHHEKV